MFKLKLVFILFFITMANFASESLTKKKGNKGWRESYGETTDLYALKTIDGKININFNKPNCINSESSKTILNLKNEKIEYVSETEILSLHIQLENGKCETGKYQAIDNSDALFSELKYSISNPINYYYYMPIAITTYTSENRNLMTIGLLVSNLKRLLKNEANNLKYNISIRNEDDEFMEIELCFKLKKNGDFTIALTPR